MKKNSFRLLSLVLALLLCLAVFAACKNKEPAGSEDPKDTSGSEEATTSKPRPVLPVDKLPPLDEGLVANNGESLAGYSIDQLTQMWGSPIAELYGSRGYVWELPDDYDYVIAYFDEENYVTETIFHAVVKATVTSISDGTVTVAPVEGEKEAASNESLTLSLSVFQSKVQDTLAEGTTVYIAYSGTVNEDHSLEGVTYAGTAKPSSRYARF